MRMKEAFKVLKPFRDLQDKNKTNPNGREYAAGDLYPAVFLDLSDERVEELTTKKNRLKKVILEKIEQEEEEEAEVGEV